MGSSDIEWSSLSTDEKIFAGQVVHEVVCDLKAFLSVSGQCLDTDKLTSYSFTKLAQIDILNTGTQGDLSDLIEKLKASGRFEDRLQVLTR